MPRFLNDTQEMFRETAERFVKKELEPVATQIDHEDRVPEHIIRRCAELSFFGLYVSEEYGGVGRNLTAACVVLEEIAKASPALGGLLNVEIVLCPASIELAGTEAQKQKYLVPSASGEKLLAWSFSEPVGATNIDYHQTKITRQGDHYVLDGAKLFTSQGSAQHVMVFGRTQEAGNSGYGIALIDIDAPGVSVAPYESKLGWRGTNTGSISYTNVHVPAENILGNLTTGLAQVADANAASIIGHAVTSLGCMEGLFDKTLAYVKERNLFGVPMARLQPISYWLGEVYAKIEACRSLIYSCTAAWDQGQRDPFWGPICKTYVCDTAFDVSCKLLQMWGGSGIMDSTGVNRYMRDARTNMVAEAASEFYYDRIASGLLGFEPVRGS